MVIFNEKTSEQFSWLDFCFQIKGVTYLYTRAQVAEDTDNHVTLLISNYRKG